MANQGNLFSKTLVIGIIFLFIGMSVVSSTGNIDKASFIFKSNNPPYEPSNPIPQDGAENVSIYVSLCWTGGDPDGDEVLYDVYFGNCSPPPLYSDNLTGNCTDPPPWSWLDYNTTYYWKIVAWDEHGASTEGPIWSFTTEPNYPPDPAHDPIPPDGADNVPGDAILCWNGSDPNSGDMLTYDVYFGITYPPILVSLNQTETCYDPYGTNDMPLFAEYYWRIVTWDREGEFTSSPIWSFTTGIPIPPAPTIDGPTQGKIRVKYEYTFNSTHDSMWGFFVNWGDGSPIEIVTPTFPDRHQAKANHSWKKKATYNISARTQDIFYGYSEWGYLEVTIPRNKATVNSLFQWFFDRFSLLEVIILRAMNLLR